MDVDLVAVRLPAGEVWHALVPGDLETLCGRIPMRDEARYAVARAKPFPVSGRVSHHGRARDNCRRCVRAADELG